MNIKSFSTFFNKKLASTLATILVIHLQLTSCLWGIKHKNEKEAEEIPSAQILPLQEETNEETIVDLDGVFAATQGTGEIDNPQPADENSATKAIGARLSSEGAFPEENVEEVASTTQEKDYDKLLKRYASGYIVYPELLRSASLFAVFVAFNTNAGYDDKINVLIAAHFGQGLADALVTFYGARYWQTLKEKDKRLQGWHGYWMIPAASLDGVLKFAGGIGLIFDQIFLPGIAWVAWIP